MFPLLAIDLGKNTGLSVWKDAEKPFNCKTVVLKCELFPNRLEEFGKLIRANIETFGIKTLVCENCAGLGKWMAKSQLHQYIGYLHCIAQDAGIELEMVHQMTVKKILTGNGKAKKEAILPIIQERWFPLCKSKDAADAVAIGYACIHKDDPKPDKVKKERKKKDGK